MLLTRKISGLFKNPFIKYLLENSIVVRLFEEVNAFLIIFDDECENKYYNNGTYLLAIRYMYLSISLTKERNICSPMQENFHLVKFDSNDSGKVRTVNGG